MSGLLFIAILPVILLLIYIYKKDPHKEPFSNLIKIFIFGIFSTIPAVIGELIAAFFLEQESSDYLMLFIYIFIGVALIEEFVKWKIKKGNLFTDIKAELDKVNSQLIGEKEDDVKIGSHGTKPHSFEYGGKTYYVTKELGDKNQSDLFYKFRKYVNKQYKDFQIVEITK